MDDPLDMDIFTYKVKVTFDSFHVITNQEWDGSPTDIYRDENEIFIYAYVQGKKVVIFDPNPVYIGANHASPGSHVRVHKT